MKIIIDAFGGDNAPLEVLKGVSLAKSEVSVSLAVTGDKQKILECATQNNIDIEGVEIIDAPTVIETEDDPKVVLKAKKDSSMAVGLSMVANDSADAFVSAGSTAALLMGATMIVGRIKGVKRPALGAVIPSANGKYLLLDCGANSECRPEMLAQFGAMGSAYVKHILGIDAPKVGLANNGAEESKGTAVQIDAFKLLSKNKNINFIGNVEGRDIPKGAADVVVADGFTGNIILKVIEGLSMTLFGMLKEIFYKSLSTKLAAAVLKPGLREFKKKFDYTEEGGAPFIGVKKPIIKAHGSSNAKAFKNAIKQAEKWAKSDVLTEIERLI